MRLQGELRERFGVEPEVTNGLPGALDVYLDGRRIWSKQEAGGLAAPGEIGALIDRKRR